MAVLTAEDDEHNEQLEPYESCGYVGVPIVLLRLEDGARVLTSASVASRSSPSRCGEVVLRMLVTGFSVVILELSSYLPVGVQSNKSFLHDDMA